MAKADALSQWEDHAIGIEEDNKGILFIPLEQICAVSTWIFDVGDCIQDQIQEYTKAHDLAESYKNYDEEDRILSRDGKIFVLDDDNSQMEVVHLHHDTPLAGHLGQEKTLQLLERSYFWPGMSTYIMWRIVSSSVIGVHTSKEVIRHHLESSNPLIFLTCHG